MEIVYIVLGVIGLVILVFIVLWLISKSKGKIIIEMGNYNYSPGDTITGKVKLILKKQVAAKSLKVGLRGTRTQKSYSRNKGSSSHSDNIFEFFTPLDGEKEYLPGEREYEFSIKIPQNILNNSTGNKTADTLIKSAQILSGNVSSTYWYIESYLDIAGFDISKRVQINIG
jgi:hypothetical protein